MYVPDWTTGAAITAANGESPANTSPIHSSPLIFLPPSVPSTQLQQTDISTTLSNHTRGQDCLPSLLPSASSNNSSHLLIWTLQRPLTSTVIRPLLIISCAKPRRSKVDTSGPVLGRLPAAQTSHTILTILLKICCHYIAGLGEATGIIS